MERRDKWDEEVEEVEEELLPKWCRPEAAFPGWLGGRGDDFGNPVYCYSGIITASITVATLALQLSATSYVP
jgi:hypothetical protein